MGGTKGLGGISKKMIGIEEKNSKIEETMEEDGGNGGRSRNIAETRNKEGQWMQRLKMEETD